MTAPKICEYCGASLDAGEQCDCREHKRIDIKLDWRRPKQEERWKAEDKAS